MTDFKKGGYYLTYKKESQRFPIEFCSKVELVKTFMGPGAEGRGPDMRTGYEDRILGPRAGGRIAQRLIFMCTLYFRKFVSALNKLLNK